MEHDRLQPSDSEIIPFKSKKIRVFKSKALFPLIVVAAAVITFFHYIGRVNLDVYIDAFALTGVLLIFMFLYYYSGIRKPAFWYLFPAIFAGVLLHYFLVVYDLIFTRVVPGRFPADTDNFMSTFVNYTIVAGGREELLKATPALIALWISISYPDVLKQPAASLVTLIKNKLSKVTFLSGIALRGPLDGLLMGCAAGAAFILLETLLQYVPGLVQNVLKASAAKGSLDKNDIALAYSVGLQLVIPRVLQGVTGHMAWAGIFGYFIGLAAIYPQALKKLLLLGYLIPAVMHGLWDSVSAAERSFGINPDVYLIGLSAATVIVFVSFLMKARQLNVAGFSDNSEGSIVVPRPSGLGNRSFLKTESLRHNDHTGETSFAYRIISDFGELDLEVGQEIDLMKIMSGHNVNSECRALVVRHPTEANICGLKNLSPWSWTVKLADGTLLDVQPGKNLKLTDGAKILVSGQELIISEM